MASPSPVYFASLKLKPDDNLFKKIERLYKSCSISGCISPKDFVAVKLHFGEKGNSNFIRSVFVRKIAELLKKEDSFAFLTDSNILYLASRSDAVNHLETSIANGFTYSTTGIPSIIADGLKGASYEEITIDQKHFKKALIGKEIAQADCIIALSHFKAHELSGFGGALKNIGMGSGSKGGKLAMHSNVRPKVKNGKCTLCKRCIPWCPGNAISLTQTSAQIDSFKCIGCGECLSICQAKAIQINWNPDTSVFQEKIVEYAYAVLLNKKQKSAFFNFVLDVSPQCDCYPFSDTPIVPNIGILASLDPVAIDQASADLVNKTQGLPDTRLKDNILPGEDKFKGIYPHIDWNIQLDYAEKLGLGTREYDLIEV